MERDSGLQDPASTDHLTEQNNDLVNLAKPTVKSKKGWYRPGYWH